MPFNLESKSGFLIKCVHAANLALKPSAAISSVKWGLLTRNEVGLSQIFDTLKLLKTTKITISQKTPFFKITKR